MNVMFGIGSNLGDRLGNLRAAVSALRSCCLIERCSSVYETKPMYHIEQANFLNAVILAQTGLAPRALIVTTKRIEITLGRTRTGIRYGARTIDIDLVFYGDWQMDGEDLTVPHPGLAERPFVLYPMHELMPSWRHPGTGLTVRLMVNALPSDASGDIICNVAPSEQLMRWQRE